MVKIERIIEGSLAALVGINENDMLISINGHEIADVLDYRFYLAEKRVDIKVMSSPPDPFPKTLCKKSMA